MVKEEWGQVQTRVPLLRFTPFLLHFFHCLFKFTFTFLFDFCINFRLVNARMILCVSPDVPSLWAIVTSFKSLYSLSLSNVLFTCHSHTMNSYYNCSQYVVIIQLVSLRLCKFSFVLWEPFFWEYFL